MQNIWTYADSYYSVAIIGPGAVFDGCTENNVCAGGTFFKLVAQNGKATNIEFHGLTIQNYWMAIDLYGNWSNPSGYNERNVIEGCTFKRIGTISNESLAKAYSAVRLYNSRSNIISGNHFEDIVNTRKEDAGSMHAIYLASHSSNNQITENEFVRISGDAIRIRDESNYNLATKNRFIKAGFYAVFSDWYCSAPDSCSKPECPSIGNQFQENQYDALSFTNAKMTDVTVFKSDTAENCPTGSFRLRASQTILNQ